MAVSLFTYIRAVTDTRKMPRCVSGKRYMEHFLVAGVADPVFVGYVGRYM
jgi:hypothetical protein